MEKVRFKKYPLYDSIYIKLLKIQTYIQCQKASQGVVGEREAEKGHKEYVYFHLS